MYSICTSIKGRSREEENNGENRPFPNQSTSSPGANLQLWQIVSGRDLVDGDHIDDIHGRGHRRCPVHMGKACSNVQEGLPSYSRSSPGACPIYRASPSGWPDNVAERKLGTDHQ